MQVHKHILQPDWTQAESSQHPLLFLSNSFLTICPPNVLCPCINCMYLSICMYVGLRAHPPAHPSIRPSIHPCIHSPYYGNASFIIHLLPFQCVRVCVRERERGLVTAVIRTCVRDERGTLGSIPKTILILAHPAMQVMHSLTTPLNHIHTMTAFFSTLSERERAM